MLAQKINISFPGELESQYSNLLSKFIGQINTEYLKLVRQLLNESDETFTNNSLAYRRNSFDPIKFKKKLSKIKEKIKNSKAIDNIFTRMESVFKRAEQKVEKNIRKVFKKSKFPIPDLALNVKSVVLKNAVKDNVNLISAIIDKHSENLENAVISAVKGGSNFNTVVDEVMKQSKKGKKYAEFVARDQLNKTYAAINEEKSKSTGFPGYIWQSTNDSRTRLGHREMNNTFQTWDKKPLVKNSTHEKFLTGSKELHPSDDYECRCIAIPAFELGKNLEDLGFE